MNGSNHNESSGVDESLISWLMPSMENIIILILLLALVLKLIFCEDKSDTVPRQLRFQQEETEAIPEERMESYNDGSLSPTINMDMDMDMSLRQRFGNPALPAIQQPIFPLSGVGGGWIEVDNDIHVEYTDREVQTDATYHDVNESIGENSSLLKKSEVPRNVEDCLEIYKSDVRIIFLYSFIL